MAGGPKDTNIYAMVEDAINKGASGAAIGRNIFQSGDPEHTVEEISKLVHGNR
jgi:DhnA family fructose-bisphosphate aldolase class Ia